MNRIKLSTFDTLKHLQTDQSVKVSEDDLKKMQDILLEMARDIIGVCEDHGFYYVLGGGSALGAVRHRGFIPWDDDIDLNMRRKDIDPFVQVMKEKYSDKYWIRSPGTTEGHGLLFVQVRKKGTSVKTRDDFRNEECGVCVDIFPIENTWDNPLMRFIHMAGCYYYGFLVSCRKFYRDREFLLSLSKGIPDVDIAFRIKIAIGFLAAWRSLDRWVVKADRWYSLCRDEHSKDVVIPSGRKHFRDLYPRDAVCAKTEMDFENIKAACPKDYDIYLSKLYGDYMAEPAPDELETHIYYEPFDLG